MRFDRASSIRSLLNFLSRPFSSASCRTCLQSRTSADVCGAESRTTSTFSSFGATTNLPFFTLEERGVRSLTRRPRDGAAASAANEEAGHKEGRPDVSGETTCEKNAQPTRCGRLLLSDVFWDKRRRRSVKARDPDFSRRELSVTYRRAGGKQRHRAQRALHLSGTLPYNKVITAN